ncbi:MAG: hypothetical protein NTU77_14070, partial [Actinobacteria bacterium]|nr:hypothetical protein [Actinomycetota bacterium]
MTVSAAPADLFARESPDGSESQSRRKRSRGGGPRAHGLATITTIYLLWSLVPVAVAILFSFNAGRSRSVWQGFSLRWYTWDPNGSILNDPALRNALLHTITLAIIATIITVPLGVTFALALDRWRGRVPTGASFA